MAGLLTEEAKGEKSPVHGGVRDMFYAINEIIQNNPVSCFFIMMGLMSLTFTIISFAVNE